MEINNKYAQPYIVTDKNLNELAKRAGISEDVLREDLVDARAKNNALVILILTLKCKHCGQAIRKGEVGVNWPWIHNSGWYGCLGGEGRRLAWPEGGEYGAPPTSEGGP